MCWFFIIIYCFGQIVLDCVCNFDSIALPHFVSLEWDRESSNEWHRPRDLTVSFASKWKRLNERVWQLCAHNSIGPIYFNRMQSVYILKCVIAFANRHDMWDRLHWIFDKMYAQIELTQIGNDKMWMVNTTATFTMDDGNGKKRRTGRFFSSFACFFFRLNAAVLIPCKYVFGLCSVVSDQLVFCSVWFLFFFRSILIFRFLFGLVFCFCPPIECNVIQKFNPIRLANRKSICLWNWEIR